MTQINTSASVLALVQELLMAAMSEAIALLAERDALRKEVTRLTNPIETAPTTNPIETAPKDGTMLRLLVDYTSDGANPLEDARQAWTIGFNQLEDTEEDLWEFAGWNWEQDCFETGAGAVVGWLPFHANAQPLDRRATADQEGGVS